MIGLTYLEYASAFTQANDLAWNPVKHYSIGKVLNEVILAHLIELGKSRAMRELSRIIKHSLDFQSMIAIPRGT